MKITKNKKKSENLKNLKNLKKFKKSENFKNIFFFPAKLNKNYILLVLPIKEISLRPELSSPPRFRIQGGWSERYERRTEILVYNIGFPFTISILYDMLIVSLGRIGCLGFLYHRKE